MSGKGGKTLFHFFRPAMRAGGLGGTGGRKDFKIPAASDATIFIQRHSENLRSSRQSSILSADSPFNAVCLGEAAV